MQQVRAWETWQPSFTVFFTNLGGKGPIKDKHIININKVFTDRLAKIRFQQEGACQRNIVDTFSTWSRALGLGAVFAGLDMAPVRGAPGENILIIALGSYDRDP